jgi:redox-sensitive bicupin YhaK (pirin superfamily)
MRKNVLGVVPGPKGHWVGDGFPVRSLFSYDGLGRQLSPFLLLDYAGPAEFAPANEPRGVGEHPHRGFETVSIVYSGEVAHRDSAGNGGLIGPGEVQWMTAAAGILHEEFHSPAFTRTGGALEMVQLWVNLPARDKMSPPRYQTLSRERIPDLALPGNAGRLRVIAGEHDGHRGPALTFTELNVWDLRLRPGGVAELRVPPGHTTALAVLRGTVAVNGSRPATAAELVVLDRAGDEVHIEAAPRAEPGGGAAGVEGVEDVEGAAGALVLLLSGVPIAEPIVGHGPFVMNSAAEIETAIADFRSGRFGRLPAGAGA